MASMTDPTPTTEPRCGCIGGSTYGTSDPAIRRCDLCGGIVPTDPATGGSDPTKTTTKHVCEDCAEPATRRTVDDVWLCENDWQRLLDQAGNENDDQHE
jgi:hypothetical protein